MALENKLSDFLKTILENNGIDKDGILDICEIENSASKYRVASSHYALTVKFKDGSPERNLFLKICEKGSISETINKAVATFDKEVQFYSTILPNLFKFEAENWNSSEEDNLSIEKLFFKFYGSGYVKENFYIVLDKFNPEVRYVTAKSEYHNVDQIQCIMASIARFHATSFCLKHMKDIDFIKEYPILVDKCFNPVHHDVIGPIFADIFKGNVAIMKAVVNEMKSGNLTLKEKGLIGARFGDSIVERLEKLSEMVMYILYNIQDCSEMFKVICHGDFHMWNIAFSKDASMAPNLFDFQAIRCTSSMTDIHHYLSQVSTPQVRKEHLQSFLQIYYSAFKTRCHQYGLDEEFLFTFEDMMKEYDDIGPWGFLFGFMFILPRFVQDDFYAELKKTKNSGDIVNLLVEKGNTDVWDALNVYFDLLYEAEERKTIDLMEKIAFV